jgi:exosortase/archaeosortase family protein
MSKVTDAGMYVVKAAVLSCVCYVGFSLFPLERLTSDVTAHVLNGVGIAAESYEQQGRIYLEYLQISIDCTALEIIAIFLGLILAVKAPLFKRIIFSVTGSAAVFVVNILRICIVFYLLEQKIPWWLAHDLFSGGLSIMAGVVFLVISEHYMQQINENLYTLLDAAETFIARKR